MQPEAKLCTCAAGLDGIATLGYIFPVVKGCATYTSIVDQKLLSH